MTTISQETFDRAFRACLERHTDALVAALGAIVRTPVPDAIGVLSFEIQASWDDFPVYAFGMDGDFPDEVWFDRPFVGAVLEDAPPLVPEGVIDQDAYEEAGVATYERGARLLSEWFGDCWHRAGGAAFPVKAVINLHDDLDVYDLRERRWITFGDVWPDA